MNTPSLYEAMSAFPPSLYIAFVKIFKDFSHFPGKTNLLQRKNQQKADKAGKRPIRKSRNRRRKSQKGTAISEIPRFPRTKKHPSGRRMLSKNSMSWFITVRSCATLKLPGLFHYVLISGNSGFLFNGNCFPVKRYNEVPIIRRYA